MVSRRTGPALLALLLLLQWGAAFGHCLQSHPAALTLEICTAEGVRFVAWRGDPEPAPVAHGAGQACPACQALPPLTAPPPLMAPQPVIWSPAPLWRADAGARLRPPARAPPPPARAPPA